jgi:hypothetical protein
MSAAAETNQALPGNLAKPVKVAETKRNASALKCLRQVPKAEPVAMLRLPRKGTGPVTEPPVPVRWEPVRRPTAKAEPADQASAQAVADTREIAQRADRVNAQADQDNVRVPQVPHALN